jgi:fatty acid desaturase
MSPGSMGEAKRRSEQGLPPRGPQKNPSSAKDTSPRLAPWLPLTRRQADRFVQVSTQGAWVGIAALVLFWVTVRFIGPSVGWWTLSD